MKCKNCINNKRILSCTTDEQGLHHSFNDEPSMVSCSGTKFWHKNGELHRENDSPAYVYCEDGKVLQMEWFINGYRHRIGDAAIFVIGRINKQWFFYEGRQIINVSKLSDNTFQYEKQVGLILEHIEDNIYLGLLGDTKRYIGLENG